MQTLLTGKTYVPASSHSTPDGLRERMKFYRKQVAKQIREEMRRRECGHMALDQRTSREGVV